MREQNENLASENVNLCALTMTLMNLLLFLIVSGTVWVIYQVVDNPALYSLMNGKILNQ